MGAVAGASPRYYYRTDREDFIRAQRLNGLFGHRAFGLGNHFA